MGTFEIHEALINTLALGDYRFVIRMFPKPIAKFEFELVDVGLQFDGKLNFVALDDQERLYSYKKIVGFSTCDVPAMLRTPIWMMFGMIVDVKASAEHLMKAIDNAFMRHANHYANLVSNVIANLFSTDSNHSFSVEKARNVSDFHSVTSCAVTEKLANSVDTQCPARKSAEGQYRAKQGESLGVCREHVPTAKAKICSDLRRNTQRLAEMTGLSYVVGILEPHKMITECDTKYIFLRPHKDRNFVPIGGERQAVNQDAVVKLIGWAGNLTCSNSSLQGVLKA